MSAASLLVRSRSLDKGKPPATEGRKVPDLFIRWLNCRTWSKKSCSNCSSSFSSILRTFPANPVIARELLVATQSFSRIHLRDHIQLGFLRLSDLRMGSGVG